MNSILLLLILQPLLTGIILYHCKNTKTIWRISIAVVGVLFALSGFLLLSGEECQLLLPMFSHFGIGFQTNPLGNVYAVLATGGWLVSILVSSDYFQGNTTALNRYYASLFLALSGTLGVFYAVDLFTLVIFFELMSLSSYLWVMHNQTESAIKASQIYLSFGIAGGLSLLFGIFALSTVTTDLRLTALQGYFATEALQEQALMPAFFLLLGFGAKAGLFLIHDWMPTAYTASPAPSSGLLSGILSKCGVYGILLVAVYLVPQLRNFATLLLILSVFNMLIGAGAAFLSGNLKRTFAFSSVSQMGFIFWGIAFSCLLGSHNSFAIYGTLFHMVNHSLLKILLYSLSGVVEKETNTLELDDLKGFGRGKPWFHGLFLLCAVTMGGVPLFSGYISKTLLHESVVEYMHYFPYLTGRFFYLYEWAFLLAGGCTVAYMLKLYDCLFLQTGKTKTTDSSTLNTILPLATVGLVLLGLGMTANVSFAWLSHYTEDFFGVHALGEVDYFSWTNLKGGLTSIAIGLVLFATFKTMTKNLEVPEFTEKLNPDDNFIEKLYRPMISYGSLIFAVCMRIFDVFLETIALRISQRGFKPLAIPETFYYGQENKAKKKDMAVRITQSLAYSLLMFGIGFIFTIVYLLVVGGTLSY